MSISFPIDKLKLWPVGFISIPEPRLSPGIGPGLMPMVRGKEPQGDTSGDRWHLLRNLTEAFLTVVDRHTAAARRVMAERNKHLASGISSSDMPRKDKPLTAAQRASQAALARRSARFDEAAALKAQGHSYQHIAKIIGAGRKTVGRWLRQGHAPVWTPPPRSSIVAPYAAYLNKRQAEGCRNASQLWREIVALGFPGKFSIVHQWLGPRRQKLPAQNTPSRVTAPLGRKLAQLLLANPTSRPEAENDFISRLFSSEPALAPATTWTGKMQALLRKKSDADIDHLLEEGEQTLLSNFVTGLRRDINAIKAALTTPSTTSPVEGQISRLKMLKRTMFGRAGFLLLRARVLYPT